MSGAGHLQDWEGRPVDAWRARWRVPVLVALAETASTNDIARRMAEQGAPAGLLVLTEHQTAGRGRMSRSWSDSSGKSLLMSFLLRPSSRQRTRSHPATSGSTTAESAPAPDRPAERMQVAPGTAPLRVGMAVASALRTAAGIEAGIKWPNDILVDGRKVAGILCEAVSTGGQTVIVAGIGINVLQDDTDWPTELHGVATSVAQAGAAAPDRGAIMDALADEINRLYTLPLAPLDGAELRAFAALDALHGSSVVVMPGGASSTTPSQGVAAGIAPDGALLLESAGNVQRVTSGTVRHAGIRTSHTGGR